MPRIEQLSEVRGLPVLDKALIAADRRYEANVRAKVDYGIGAVQPARADVLGQRLASRKRLVHMDVAAVIRKYGSTVLGSIGVALWLVALYLLASAAQNSAEFDRWLPWILLINISGLLTLFVLLAGKLTRLVRDYRRHVPGSRLKGRTVAIFSALAVAPILVVYYFSLQFINRGIDSWFELEVSQGLKDTRELSHAALEVRVREFLQHTAGRGAHALSGQFRFRADRHARPRAARQHRARIHHRGRAGADPRHQFRSSDGYAAGARDRRDDAAIAARPALRESGHGLGGRLRDSRGGAARCQRQRQRAGADRACIRCRCS